MDIPNDLICGKLHLFGFAFYLWYASQKNPILALEKWEIIFCKAMLKILIGNVVCHAKKHLCSNFVNKHVKKFTLHDHQRNTELKAEEGHFVS
jgi:hypothetical protein